MARFRADARSETSECEQFQHMYVYIYTHKSCLLGQQQMNNSLTLMDIEELVFVLQSLHKPFWEKHGGLSLFTWK
jgi:hypothetical protein